MRSTRLGSAAAAAALVVLAGLATAPTGPAVAAPTATAAAKAKANKADARIKAKLKSRIKHPALGKDVAVRVHDPLTGKTVYSSRSTQGQLPASNMKIVTAANALTVIGPSTRFPTRVVRGSSSTHIVLVGGGDPLLASGDLGKLAYRTVAALKKGSATGTAPQKVRLTVDATLFPKPTRAPGWRTSYGLSEVSPVRALARRGVASKDTVADARTYFVKQLKARGVAASYAGLAGKRATGVEIARFEGHRVDQAVRAMMPPSDNQIAEVLFRQVALHSGRSATWGNGAKAARAALAKAKVPLSGVAIKDGSGLSRSNRLTAAALVAILRRAEDGGTASLNALMPSMPVAGRSGTLRSRYTSSPTRCARGKVKAKTGYIDGVVALSGVARGADGRPRVFSIVANSIPSSRHSVRSTQLAVDRLAATITGCH